MLQRRTEVATRRKEMGSKRVCNITMRLRHKIETYEGKKTTDTITTKKSKSQHEVIIQTEKWSQPKTEVATQKLEEKKDNDVATCN